MTYRVNVTIPVEVKDPNPRVVFQTVSSQALCEEVDLTDEA